MHQEDSTMNRTIALSLLALVAVLVGDAGAGSLDSTSWTIDGKDVLLVTTKGPARTPVTGATFTVDSASNFTATLPDATYSGKVADNGKHGFRGTPDAATVSAMQTKLVDYAKSHLNASSVTVRKMTASMSGKRSKNGQKLSLKFTFRFVGTAVVGGRSYGGTVTETGTYAGHPM
jgi:hypothetical protein